MVMRAAFAVLFTGALTSRHAVAFIPSTTHRWFSEPRHLLPERGSTTTLKAATADDLLAQAAALRKEADEAAAEVEREKRDR